MPAVMKGAVAVVVAAVAADAEDVVIDRFLLQWHITERCDLQCRHCYQDERPVDDLALSDLLQVWEQYRTFLKRLRQEADGAVQGYLTITGGEPLIHDDFWPLMEQIVEAKTPCRLAILTNGTQIDRDVARRLAQMKLRYVQVSIDGTQATHDAIRGPGSFDAAVRGIEHLVRANVCTILSMTVHRENFREFPDVARLGKKLKVRKVWSDRLLPFGRGGLLEPLTKDEVHEWLTIMSQTKATLHQKGARQLFGKAPFGPFRKKVSAPFSKTEIALDRALQSLVPGGTPYRCSAGKTLLAVGARGEVYPCRRMPHEVGNLFERPLEEIYDSSPFLQKLREDQTIYSGCEGCRHFSHCGGGLRCYSYAKYGDPFHADPGCFYAEEV